MTAVHLRSVAGTHIKFEMEATDDTKAGRPTATRRRWPVELRSALETELIEILADALAADIMADRAKDAAA